MRDQNPRAIARVHCYADTLAASSFRLAQLLVSAKTAGENIPENFRYCASAAVH
jgi:hypothetical protein